MTGGTYMNDLKIYLATAGDEKNIKKLLIAAQLPHEDIHEHLQNFLVARYNKMMVGAVGLEIYGTIGLLRSLVVSSVYQSKGVGRMLYERVIAYARIRGVKDMYLLTTTADKLFKKQGFVQVDREKMPDVIKKTDEFLHLCPASAICMRKNIEDEVFHITSDLLRLRSKMPGVGMWAIALNNVMFTYFEIEPGARFKEHKHVSEQITYVLEGDLYFTIADRTVRVGPGEAIAIPSNVPHAACIKEKRVRAVDAWSPIRSDYLG
jgi:amino-acid N-acetyltransferase